MLCESGAGPLSSTQISGQYAVSRASGSPPSRLAIQHAGPKLSGYSSATLTATVTQNATSGFLRSVMPALDLKRLVADGICRHDGGMSSRDGKRHPPAQAP